MRKRTTNGSPERAELIGSDKELELIDDNKEPTATKKEPSRYTATSSCANTLNLQGQLQEPVGKEETHG